LKTKMKKKSNYWFKKWRVLKDLVSI
jgi:hypothetical protein